MRRKMGGRRYAALLTFVATAATALFIVPAAFATVTHAAFTSVNQGVDGTTWTDGTSTFQNCLNGNPNVNCNLYTQKRFVWLNGGPLAAQLDSGTYMWAVLSPGGQPTPNDGTAATLDKGTPKNLSDDVDASTNRQFSTDGTTVTNLGTHDYDSSNGKIRVGLAPNYFSDTLNPGGVYILAICKISASTSAAAITPTPIVNPRDCKYDAFKVVSPDTTVPPLADLTVTKDATPAFDRTWTWTTTKTIGTPPASSQTITTTATTATFNYTVKAVHSAPVNSAYTVVGNIYLLNNGAADATNVAIPAGNDLITYLDSSSVRVTDTNATCAVDATGFSGTVVAGGNATLPYSCTYSPDVPLNATERNDVTVNFNNGSVDTTAIGNSDDFNWSDGTLGNPTNHNRCSDITDTLDSVSTTLGTACAPNPTDAVPAASWTAASPFPSSYASFTEAYAGDTPSAGMGTFTFTYSHTFAVPHRTPDQAQCDTHTNTAYVVGGNSGPVTATVCGTANTGALTIGFWKTTNGQSLIGSYCSNGSANLGTFLKTLGPADQGPFSTAPTTCSGLKTFVSGILTGANAKDMNSMLKAQMLGTALDVWFSGPGWQAAGSKTKTPGNFLSHNNLGSFKMDTTSVCPMVDNLNTGTATCSNSTPSTNAVTALAVPTSPMSMQELLDFASTVPPYNGYSSISGTTSSIWYGGDRTKEEILKNIFDQFNNGNAFGTF